MMPLFLLFLFAFIPTPATSHPVTLAYMDVRPATETTPLLLTVAIHPHQALLLVGLPHEEAEEEGGFGHQILDLKDRAALIGAYLSSHVAVSAQGAPCAWEPTDVFIPDTELGALADGISMTAPLVCKKSTDTLDVTSTIFIDTFPGQQTVVRLELPDGFAERLLLDRATTTGTVSLIAPIVEPEARPVFPADVRVTWIGWSVVLLVLGGMGVVAYRMNMASPKE